VWLEGQLGKRFPQSLTEPDPHASDGGEAASSS
jgi:hypothetical protein